jgi:hypothetical protein
VAGNPEALVGRALGKLIRLPLNKKIADCDAMSAL